MNYILLIFKLQYKLFLFLFFVTVLPLVAVYQFLPDEFDKSYYFFLTFLVGLRFSFFKGNEHMEKVKKSVREALISEMGRVPSTNDIVKRLDEVATTRDYIFGVCGLCIILISALYGNL
ncbi:MAG: hypothetical protein BM556_12135 [Bacteriovorax sp. MedPE-SWde]|nr:MAG: hypothetical protein BM556_12135 [Bacteriovorax sp. MedPE-SWde]